MCQHGHLPQALQIWALRMTPPVQQALVACGHGQASLLPQCPPCCMQSGWVDIVSLLVIITNTAVMASQSYPGSPQWQVVSDYLNVAFCLYFTAELLVKLLASSIRSFARDRMNQFDALVVAASLVEVVMFLVPGDETSECRMCLSVRACIPSACTSQRLQLNCCA